MSDETEDNVISIDFERERWKREVEEEEVHQELHVLWCGDSFALEFHDYEDQPDMVWLAAELRTIADYLEGVPEVDEDEEFVEIDLD